MCEVFTVVNDIGSAYLKKYFALKDRFHETRTAMPLVVLKFNSVKFGKGSLNYEGVFLWNNLENTFKLSTSVKGFKGTILKWIGPLCQRQTCFFM